MKKLREESGTALITALMFTLIGLGIVMAVLYMVTQGIQTSASQKRYKTALAAAYGGADVVTKAIVPQLFSSYSTGKIANDFAIVGLQSMNRAALNEKLYKPTLQWDQSKLLPGNSINDPSSLYNPKISPDFKFNLKGDSASNGFTVYNKIVDTVPGNSNTSGLDLLDSGAGVTGTGNGISPKHIPGMYRIEIQGERTSNPKEKAQLSVLYSY